MMIPPTRNSIALMVARLGLFGSLALTALVVVGILPYELLPGVLLLGIATFMCVFCLTVLNNRMQVTLTELAITVSACALVALIIRLLSNRINYSGADFIVALIIVSNVLIFMGSLWGWHTKKRLQESKPAPSIFLLLKGWMLAVGISSLSATIILFLLYVLGVRFNVTENDPMIFAIMAALSLLSIPAISVELGLRRNSKCPQCK